MEFSRLGLKTKTYPNNSEAGSKVFNNHSEYAILRFENNNKIKIDDKSKLIYEGGHF